MMDWLREQFGVRALRCGRCMFRFSAFAPSLRALERRSVQPVMGMKVEVAKVQAPLPPNPLQEIATIEDEWNRRIQPQGMVEETLCAQLAHATWHLRCLHRAERESIASAVAEQRFNGEWAASLMTWRRSSESAIQEALGQLQAYRRGQDSTGDLMALARGIGGDAGRHPLTSDSVSDLFAHSSPGRPPS